MGSELRERRTGQLQKLQKTRRDLGQQAENAMTVIQQKVDPYIDNIERLDTAAIRKAAEDLDRIVREMRQISPKIEAIREELYG